MTGPVIVASAAWYAERAMLGAVVRQPELATGTAPLTVEEFGSPEHAAVWTAVLGVQGESGQVRDPADVALAPAVPARVLQNATVVAEAVESRRFSETDVVHPRRLMHEVLAAAPSNIFDVAMYEVVVREAAGRRRLDGLGLRPAAASGGITGDLGAAAMTSQELADRKRVLSNVYREAREESRSHAGPGSTPASNLADPTTPLPKRLVDRQEAVLIRAMLADPAARERNLLELFQPEDFGLAKHASAWRAMQIAFERHGQLRPITVAWESEKLSTLTALSVMELTAMTREPPSDLALAVVVVARAAWTRYNDVPARVRAGDDTAPHARADRLPHNTAGPADQRRRAATEHGSAAVVSRN
ncbi:DnaB-like helicase N-terminal domain-containing protein [Lentzea sp. NPDC102401]|uniref:DnaB-like helicase N-terminal domain-containing protein n=1 Tax=Lentzea sp. NPDC102401 TaxID=3364128 RepID=UPI00382A45CD